MILMCEDRFVKYDGVKIVDLKLEQSWVISIGNVDELLKILNNKCDKKELIEEYYNPQLEGYNVLKKFRPDKLSQHIVKSQEEGDENE